MPRVSTFFVALLLPLLACDDSDDGGGDTSAGSASATDGTIGNTGGSTTGDTSASTSGTTGNTNGGSVTDTGADQDCVATCDALLEGTAIDADNHTCCVGRCTQGADFDIPAFIACVEAEENIVDASDCIDLHFICAGG